MTADKTRDVTIKRGRQTDVVVLKLPTLPDRERIGVAIRTAVGWRPGDFDVAEGTEPAPSGPASDDDAMAVMWAALGLSWAGPKIPDAPSFRGLGRDVVAYGEAFATALWDAGYNDAESVNEAASEAWKWIDASVTAAYAKVEADRANFPAPPR